ncbi:hypothetical protein GCM10010233_61370 [Streptomyces pseudogriseolus]|uniref:DUF3159 domain-containing protein n=1 Tax=Streptomyces pseudogriseolus TaxID=36817 RepID=UPI0016750649|nr:hypothetical protein GCM10010233_61370 [Streptomyces gancidicus]
MPDEGNARKPMLRPPRRAADVGRHIIDAAAAPAAFLATESRWGPEWGAIVALLVALAVAVIRRHRGDPLLVVTVSTAIVAFHSVSAIAFGEGRGFYFPELVVNAVGLVVCVVSLLIGRPISEAVCRRTGLEPAHTAGDPSARRRHRRLTAAWTVLWTSHLVPLGYLYATDSVVGLTLLSALFAKPTLLAMAAFTVVVVRRAAPLHPGSPPEQGATATPSRTPAAPRRKDLA